MTVWTSFVATLLSKQRNLKSLFLGRIGHLLVQVLVILFIVTIILICLAYSISQKEVIQSFKTLLISAILIPWRSLGIGSTDPMKDLTQNLVNFLSSLDG